MKKAKQSRSEKRTLSLKKFQIASIGNPEKIKGGDDGGWTVRKDKDECKGGR